MSAHNLRSTGDLHGAAALQHTSRRTPVPPRFGPFELDVDAGELRRDGQPVKLPPQPVRILALLVAQPGRVVTRQQIRDAIWGGDVHVDFDRALNFALKQIRGALDDDPEAPRYVETLRGRGYRFIAPVVQDAVEAPAPAVVPVPAVPEPVAGTFAPQRPSRALAVAAVAALTIALAGGAWWAGRPPEVHSSGPARLAVLPFDNLSGDPNQAYVADGLTEETIAALARSDPERLGVIARTSSQSYRSSGKTAADIGRELRADYLLEGSVRTDGERLRVVAQLIRIDDETHVWTQTYDRRADDLLAVQRDLAEAVASEISSALVPRAPAPAAALARGRPSPDVDPRAYDAYLRGRYHWNKRTRDGFLRSVEQFEKAIAIAPDYAPVYVGLADAYMLATGFLHAPAVETLPKAIEAARKAVSLDPNLADAYATLGYLRFRYDYDWPAAEEAFRRAIELDPGAERAHQWYGLSLVWAGHFDEGAARMQAAMDLDPLSVAIQTDAAWSYYFAADYDRALAQFDRALALEPDYVPAHRRRGWTLQMQGRHAEALESFERAYALSDGDRIEAAALARGYAMAGRRADAMRIIRELQESDPEGTIVAYSVGEVYAAMGERDLALEWLERAYETRSFWLVFIRHEPVFDRLRDDPRFDRIVARIRW